MSSFDNLKDFPYQMAPGQRVTIHRRGNFVRCTSARSPVSISVDDGEETTYAEGLAIRYPDEFRRVTIVNGDLPQAVTVYVGYGEIDDSRMYGAIDATIAPASAAVSGSHTALGVGEFGTIPARERSKVTVFALPTNAGFLHVGPGAGADSGYVMGPGGSFTFTTTAAINIYAADVGGSFGYIEEI